MKKEKRIPTILGLVLLLGGIVGGVFLTNRKTNLNSSASGSCTPINPQITNITNSSFNVSFTTSSPCLSNIIVDNRTIKDTRFVDTGNKETSVQTHYFEVSSLKENSSYQFSIISNGDEFKHPNYLAQTGKKPSTSIPTSNLAWGRVFTQNQKPAEGSIVYLNITGASPLSALVTSSGNWNISLATSFNDRKDNWFTPPSNQSEDFIVISSDNQATQITGNTNRNNPVPDIIIGQNQFSELPLTGDTNTQQQSGYIDTLTPLNVDKSLTIDNPKENETIFTSRPDFFGAGPINSKINVQIESLNQTKIEVSIGANGIWHWSPTQDLKSGQYVFVVSLLNDSSSTIKRKFTVVSQNNVGISFSASDSASLNTPTPSPTNSPTIVPTAKSTVKPSPTTKSTPTTVVRSSKVSTDSGVPKTGFPLPTFVLIGLSAIFILVAFKRM